MSVMEGRIDFEGRPQEKINALKFRVRQINFGVANLEFPSNHLIDWRPTNRMCEPRLAPASVKSDKGELKYVAEPDSLSGLKHFLERQSEFSLRTDGEYNDSIHGYITYLIFATWDDNIFVVPATQMYSEIKSTLKDVLENASILKIMNNCSQDVLALQRNFDIYLNGVIDISVLMSIVHQRPALPDIINYPVDELDRLENYEESRCFFDWKKKYTHLSELQMRNMGEYVSLLMPILEFFRKSLPRPELEIAFLVSNNKTRQLFQVERREINYFALAETILNTMDYVPSVTPFTVTLEITLSVAALLEFRHRIAKIADKKEEDVMNSRQLLRLASLQWPDVTKVVDICPKMDGILANQVLEIVDILNAPDTEAHMHKVRSLICRNCRKTFHGPAIFCTSSPISGHAANYNRMVLRDNVE